MNRVIEFVAGFFLVPVMLLKRYFDARREIAKVRNTNSRFRAEHVANAKVLHDRLALLACLPPGGVAAEVGVATGDYANMILEINRPAKLHLIDLWAKKCLAHGVHPTSLYAKLTGSAEAAWDIVNQRFASEIENGQVVLHRGLSWEMLASLPDYSLDWVYIDAAHDFESVKRDLETARLKVKPDGFISGHDYVRWGRFGFRGGVVEAVNEFCIENGYELIFITLEANTNPSFAIHKVVDRKNAPGSVCQVAD